MNVPSKRLFLFALLAVLVSMAAVSFGAVQGQQPGGVQAEAYVKANLRAGPGTDYPVVGEIVSGTKHFVIGRSGRFPWYLLQLPDRQGWVHKDLVMVTGDVNSVPVTEVILGTPTPAPQIQEATPTSLIEIAPLPTNTPALIGTQPVILISQTPSPTGIIDLVPPSATPTLPAATPTRAPYVFAEAVGTANVRYAPDVNAPRVGEIRKGEKYAVLQRHSLYPWIEIAYAGVASGRAWVLVDLVTVEGDLNSVPSTSNVDFGYPTLTPTPAQVVAGSAPWVEGLTGVASDTLLKLGDQLYNVMLSAGFAPRSARQGSAFLMDLRSGESVTLNRGVAYSGVSLMKVPVIIAFFRRMSSIPTAEQAQRMAEMMICSENLSSNRLLAMIGDGDEYRGALYVTETMQLLGLKNTFLIRSFFTNVTTPGATEQPFVPVAIEADQTQTAPDPSNQTTPEDMGWLLSGIYRCAVNGDGILLERFPDAITPDECRRMIRVMRANRIGAMLEAGIPPNITIAHKHGWADEVHGDAGIVFTPGGDYVLSIMLRNPTWLNQAESFPAFAEMSRLTFNAYNPSLAVLESNTRPVPETCDINTIQAFDPNLLGDLQSQALPPLK